MTDLLNLLAIALLLALIFAAARRKPRRSAHERDRAIRDLQERISVAERLHRPTAALRRELCALQHEKLRAEHKRFPSSWRGAK